MEENFYWVKLRVAKMGKRSRQRVKGFPLKFHHKERAISSACKKKSYILIIYSVAKLVFV